MLRYDHHDTGNACRVDISLNWSKCVINQSLKYDNENGNYLKQCNLNYLLPANGACWLPTSVVICKTEHFLKQLCYIVNSDAHAHCKVRPTFLARCYYCWHLPLKRLQHDSMSNHFCHVPLPQNVKPIWTFPHTIARKLLLYMTNWDVH